MGWARLSLVLAVVLACAALHAQTVTTGEVTGTVVDSTGSVVPAASVLLNSDDTGESRSVEANHAGVYRFTFVKPGSYRISSTSAGLKSDSGRLIVAVGQVQVLDLRLK